MNTVVEKIKGEKLASVYENFDLKKLNTFKVGGNLKYLVIPKNIPSLITIIKFIKANNIKYKILGNGSNVIFSSEEYNGIIIKLDELNHYSIEDNIVTAQAGVSLMSLASKVCHKGLTGMEFATGIPGSIGGAIYMNAGAYKSDMGYIVKEVTILDEELNIQTLSNKEMDFHYRTSYLKKHPNSICLQAKIILKKGNKKEILTLVKDRLNRRMESQPLNYPSAGSVFRNPDNIPAGKLIEDAGLKNTNIGGAYISDKHANFIINKKNATGEDIKKIIELTKKTVYDKYKIDLILEQELINFDER